MQDRGRRNNQNSPEINTLASPPEPPPPNAPRPSQNSLLPPTRPRKGRGKEGVGSPSGPVTFAVAGPSGCAKRLATTASGSGAGGRCAFRPSARRSVAPARNLRGRMEDVHLTADGARSRAGTNGGAFPSEIMQTTVEAVHVETRQDAGLIDHASTPSSAPMGLHRRGHAR